MDPLNEQRLYRRNIKVNYAFFFLMSLSITRGFWMIYLASKGMSLVELGILEGMFHVTSFVMETPTGAIADLFGRKFSRILSRFFLVADALLILYGTSFTHFFIAFMLCAIGWNLESGAGDAMVYDSLVEIKEEHTYMKVNGRIEMTYQGAQAAGLAIGGLIAGFSYHYLYYGQVCIIAASVAVALLFKETRVGREKGQEQEKPGFLACLKKQYIDSFKVIKGNNRLIYMIVFLNALGVFTTTTFFYMQIYCKENGMKENAIGILFAVSCILGAIGGVSAHRIEALVKERRLLFSLPIIFMILLWGMIWFKTAVVTFLIIGMFDSITYVVYFDYVNRLIPSAKRATLLSFSSMVFSSFMIIIFPAFGWIGDHFGLQYSFAFVACTATALVLINLRILIPRK
ncbi:MAG TPA: MFS transporter [Anaerovoracaceae bacterium]|nr:MFS transporter [Anaerovoracaceae bacterium]